MTNALNNNNDQHHTRLRRNLRFTDVISNVVSAIASLIKLTFQLRDSGFVPVITIRQRTHTHNFPQSSLLPAFWYLLPTLLCVLLFFTASKSAHAANLPENFSATYTVSKGIIVLAYTTRKLSTRENGEFVFESISKPSTIGKMFADGEVIERSTWTYFDDYPRPLIYTYQNTNPDKEREVKLVFDWQKKSVTNIINGDPWKMELENGVQDKLLYQLSIMLDLDRKSTALQYRVADGGSLKVYEAHIAGRGVTETPAGTFNTIKVERKSESRTTTFWCAPDLNYLPVLIEHKNNDGGRIEARLKDFTGFNYIPLDD